MTSFQTMSARETVRRGDSVMRPQKGKQGSGARKSTSTSNFF